MKLIAHETCYDEVLNWVICKLRTSSFGFLLEVNYFGEVVGTDAGEWFSKKIIDWGFPGMNTRKYWLSKLHHNIWFENRVIFPLMEQM